MLTLAKIVTTFLTVVMLAVVARRLGPRWAGVMAGFPLGSAIALYFIGVEQGAAFAAEAAETTLTGLLGSILLAVTYWRSSQHWSRPDQILLPLTMAMLAFLGAVFILQALPASLWLSLLLVSAAIVIAHRYLANIPESSAKANGTNVWQKPVPALVFRATMASISVLGITALAHILTPEQAGLLAAFPVSFTPALVVLHLSYGPAVVATAVRHYPSGLGAMVVYILCACYTYDRLSLNMGTAISLLAATLYLVVYSLYRRPEQNANNA